MKGNRERKSSLVGWTELPKPMHPPASPSPQSPSPSLSPSPAATTTAATTSADSGAAAAATTTATATATTTTASSPAPAPAPSTTAASATTPSAPATPQPTATTTTTAAAAAAATGAASSAPSVTTTNEACVVVAPEARQPQGAEQRQQHGETPQSPQQQQQQQQAKLPKVTQPKPKQQQQRQQQQAQDASAAQSASPDGAQVGQKRQQQSKQKGAGKEVPQAPSPAVESGGDSASKQKHEPAKKPADKKVTTPQDAEQVTLFSHLPQYQHTCSLTASIPFSGTSPIPPAIIDVGLKYANFSILGSNARCLAMLSAFRKVISTYPQPVHSSTLSRELEPGIKLMVKFMVSCRPISASMGNAIKYLKRHIGLARDKASVEEERKYLLECIDDFIQKRILMADDNIVSTAVLKIANGDVILTHASSHVVKRILLTAHSLGKNFSVVIVDSRPLCEGLTMARELSVKGLKCTYVLPRALSYVMRGVTKVLVGAFAMYSNGSLMSRVGTAMIASLCTAYRVPFIVCCETYKFSDSVLLDSFCKNQLDDPHLFAQPFQPQYPPRQRLGVTPTSAGSPFPPPAHSLLTPAKTLPDNLKILNLMYDVTPIESISMVITEFGMLPPTSVPVIIREFRADQTV